VRADDNIAAAGFINDAVGQIENAIALLTANRQPVANV
jgi:hypothetical protein